MSDKPSSTKEVDANRARNFPSQEIVNDCPCQTVGSTICQDGDLPRSKPKRELRLNLSPRFQLLHEVERSVPHKLPQSLRIYFIEDVRQNHYPLTNSS